MTQDGPPTEGDSALLVAIPEAEPVVADLRRRHDLSASVGVPVHVTVLYPFVPRNSIGKEVRDELHRIFGGMTSFAYAFRSVGLLGTGTVVLNPEPAAAFSRLTSAVHRRWPEHPPYGGVYETVVPHLTVGDALDGETAAVVRRETAGLLERHGAVRGVARSIALMTCDDAGQWSIDSAFALAGGVP